MTNFKLWLSILDNSDFNNMDPFAVYEKKRVCADHFDDDDNSPGAKKLKFNVVPHLNGKHIESYLKILKFFFCF